MSVRIMGSRMTPQDACDLMHTATLPELAWAADEACTARHPEPIRSYMIDRNINYTNICVSGCRFCAFYRKPGDPDGFVLTTEQILQKIREAVDLGATQILMQGGLHPELRIEYFENLLKTIKAHFNVQVHCLSAPEVVHISDLSSLSIKDTLMRLREAGLDSLPGGGAEILSDSVRRCVSPDKCSADQWIEVMRTASQLGMRATATMVFGMGEDIEARVEHLERIRALQDETGVFTAFIPWPFQPGNTQIDRRPTGAHDYLRMLAISRLYLDNIDNVQASWVTQGPAVAQLALRFGANDVGSTMIEENVVAATGVTHKMSERDLIELIHASGFDAAQRTTLYEILKVHYRR
ncbi:MAG: dehypoxanthine futalosine cyclase [Armatimonadetes bacterium]|nr:dehypoxanthine futalosine cyclase [Armatimonadota bacterium]